MDTGTVFSVFRKCAYIGCRVIVNEILINVLIFNHQRSCTDRFKVLLDSRQLLLIVADCPLS